tara:strand:+ start:3296 stop:3754 length:459 start_codon:yes stop_codon:yes gene_type:complete
MKKTLFLTAGILLLSFSLQAQEKSKQSSLKSIESTKPDYTKKQSAFRAAEDNFNPQLNKNSKESLLQELYFIEDERLRIEKNESLSSNERSQKIQSNNIEYNSKREEFKNYVSSKGILNVSKQEQNYYLSILKQDKEIEEYKKNIALIKNSK